MVFTAATDCHRATNGGANGLVPPGPAARLPACSASGGLDWLFFRRAATCGERALPQDLAGHRRSVKMARLEAVLFLADAALSTRRLAQLATLADAAEARTLVEELNAAYERDGCAFRVERVASGYRLLTRPEYAPWLDRLHRRQSTLKLSPPALETLTILAYRQPVTRADIEAVRGVQSSEMLKLLMDRGLVRIAGEEDSLGRPYLYETTRQFLELFGLRSLDDLPGAEGLRQVRTPENEDSEAASQEFGE